MPSVPWNKWSKIYETLSSELWVFSIVDDLIFKLWKFNIRGVKKFYIQTLRVRRGDKMKPFCYVTNIWQVLHFLARGPWRVWRRMVLQKLLKILGYYIIFIRDILPKFWRMSHYKSGNDYGSSMMGPSILCPWCQRIPEQCFPQLLD